VVKLYCFYFLGGILMKSYHKAQTKIIIINMVICLALILGLIIHSYNNFSFGIVIITLLLIMNGLSFISSIKMKSHIQKVESRLELLEEVLESAPNAVFVHRKLKFTYLNKKAAEFFGIENPENIIGKPVEDYVKINEVAEGTKVQEKEKRFIANFYCYAFIGIMTQWIREGAKEQPKVIIRDINRLIEGDIKKAIEKYM